jgi:hypothetical protein
VDPFEEVEEESDDETGDLVGGNDDDEENDQGHFLMVARWGTPEQQRPGGDGYYAKESKVTETEDVSYVSSPYLPHCVSAHRLLGTLFTH